MPRTVAPRYRKHLIALAASAALAPCNTWALDLAESPPGTVEPYVRPNVILSLDDSTSMNAAMFATDGTSLGTRTKVLVDAVKDTFSDTSLLPDGKIRLAWQTMNNCVSVDGVKAGTLLAAPDAASGTKHNVMRKYEGSHRSLFMKFMTSYNSCGFTPTHDLMKAADSYLRAPTQFTGPWSGNPGGSDSESSKYLGCRRNFHVVLTDGGWNGTRHPTPVSNYDNNPANWPANIPTAPVSQTRLYSDTETETTIADWAFYSWANPLQAAGNLSGALEPGKDYRTAPATETFENKVTHTKATLDRFWNPKYNPATWANLVTFTIGFSGDALPKKNYNAAGTNIGSITNPTSLLPYGYDGNFADYANGTYSWKAYGKDRGHDMWHAALNSRGQFYAVEKGEDLKAAFRQIIGNINTATDPDLSSSATSGSNVSRSEVGKYTAAYEPDKNWKGFVVADKVQPDGTT